MEVRNLLLHSGHTNLMVEESIKSKTPQVEGPSRRLTPKNRWILPRPPHIPTRIPAPTAKNEIRDADISPKQ